jgi:hypothetical protein
MNVSKTKQNIEDYLSRFFNENTEAFSISYRNERIFYDEKRLKIKRFWQVHFLTTFEKTMMIITSQVSINNIVSLGDD